MIAVAGGNRTAVYATTVIAHIVRIFGTADAIIGREKTMADFMVIFLGSILIAAAIGIGYGIGVEVGKMATKDYENDPDFDYDVIFDHNHGGDGNGEI